MKPIVYAGLCAVAVLSAAGARAGDLIVNGGFETGAFSPWTETDQAGGSGSFFVQQYGQGTPLNGFPTPTQATGGTFFASTDQGGPGSHTISQDFSATGVGTYMLSFDAYVTDQSGQAPVGVGPDYNTIPNQHSEVDLNGVQVYYGAFSPGWQTYTFDVSANVVAGLNTLSFNEVDNQGFYNQGVDNVSLAGAGGVPEPATWAMMLLGFAAAGATLRRRSRVLSA
ncbi:MAG: PEPxxWA-CTERM sorting domain-containing protein [Caulobacteraceae bacterium]